MLLFIELKSTRPFPRNSGHFEDGSYRMAAEMINSVAFELAKMIGGCCKKSERTYVASCERTWEI